MAGYRAGYISADGRAWDGKKWVAPTPEQLAEHAKTHVSMAKVTTLHDVPGFRTVESYGIVSVLAAASGFTAGTKGNDALARAQGQLLGQATEMGANAVVGVVGSSFGAGGGITSAFGGDAVGIMLMGTAVRVEPLEA